MVTRILIADDHSVVRAGLRQLLLQKESVSVVGEAADGDRLMAMAESTPADILLLDVSMPGPPFLDLLHRLHSHVPALRILVLTMHPEEQFAKRALKAGASGYLTKDRTPEELLDAITKIERGGRYISASLADRLASTLGGDFDAAPHDTLSDREMQVLLLLGNGNSVKQVSETLQLSMKTVSTFRTRLMKKMAFSSNADIVQYVARHALLRPGAA